MRLNQEQIEAIRSAFAEIIGDGKAYLFGSRTDDAAKGGDIDLLIITPQRASLESILRFKTRLLRRLGEQKIDVVNYAEGESASFLDIISREAIEL
ncbi:MAG: nucleotidyltransferase family protein [Chloroflexota bacterium]